ALSASACPASLTPRALILPTSSTAAPPRPSRRWTGYASGLATPPWSRGSLLATATRTMRDEWTGTRLGCYQIPALLERSRRNGDAATHALDGQCSRRRSDAGRRQHGAGANEAESDGFPRALELFDLRCPAQRLVRQAWSRDRAHLHAQFRRAAQR